MTVFVVPKDAVRLKINNIRVYFGFASTRVEYSIFFPPKSTLTANGVISRHRFVCDSSGNIFVALSSSLDHLGVASHLRDEAKQTISTLREL